MNFLRIINSLRKFLAFLVGLFPTLAVFGAAIHSFATGLLEMPAIKPHWEKFLEFKQVKAIQQLIARFYFGSYEKDQLDLQRLPSEGVAILRPVFLISALLCILVPAALLAPGFVVCQIKLNNGADALVAGWSICLWIAAAALAWGCMLAGTGVSNRAAFVVAVSIYIWCFGACAFYLPRSVWNAFLPAGAIIATWISESALKRPGARNLIASIVAALAVGYSAGMYLAALTPLHAYLVPHQTILGPIIGMVLCLGAVAVARFVRPDKVMSISGSSFVLSSVVALYLIGLIARAGLGPLAEQILSLLAWWNSSLWPVWYFIGAGIVFKLLKNSKVISQSIQDLVHPRLFLPLVLAAVAVGTIVTWSEDLATGVVMHLPLKLSEFLLIGYANCLSWLWRNPLAAFSAQWMRWVFLFEIAAIGWLVAKRRLNNESAAAILFSTALCWFFITEYLFEFSSFNRSPTHSIVILTIFAIGILWLFHSILLPISLKSSPWWPSRGRLPMYGAIMLFCLLEIHARTAARDFNVMNSTFLLLFRGVIDIGIPYFLYVFATRRFKELPLQLKYIFSLFCLGALFSLPLNILDKLALCGGSLAQFQSLWDQQVHLSIEKGITSLGTVFLPDAWIVLRSLLMVGAMVAVGVVTKCKLSKDKKAPAAVLFAMMAFASGLASFSKTPIDLPLNPKVLVLLSPIHNSMFIDSFLISTYLAAWLGALILGLTLSWKNEPNIWRWILGAAAASVVTWFIQFIYPNHEAWLGSTGMLVAGGLTLELILVYLLLLAVRRVDGLLSEKDEVVDAALTDGQMNSGETPGGAVALEDAAPVVSNRELHVIFAMLLTVFSVIACIQLYSTRLVAVNIPCMKREAKIPADWGAAHYQSGAAIFAVTESSGIKSTLILNAIAANPGGANEMLKQMLQDAVKNNIAPNIAVTRLEDWDHYCHGARAMSYSYDLILKSGKFPMLGVTAVVPRADNLAEVYVLSTPPPDMEKHRWELARIVSQTR